MKVVHSLLSIVKYGAILAIVLAVGHAFGIWKLPFVGKQLADHEVECIAGAITSDARYPGDLDVEVRRAVADAVVSYSEKYKTDICDVFKKGLTLVPRGFVRKKLGVPLPYFRDVRYIRNSAEYSEAGWLADLEIAKESRGKLGLLHGGATHYARSPRISDWIAQPKEAVAEIEAKMKLLGRAKRGGVEVGGARFFE
ncbi:hypothetical protein EBR66_04255 [bacterium]|nr:hypothetical protein [bacterium]